MLNSLISVNHKRLFVLLNSETLHSLDEGPSRDVPITCSPTKKDGTCKWSNAAHPWGKTYNLVYISTRPREIEKWSFISRCSVIFVFVFLANRKPRFLPQGETTLQSCPDCVRGQLHVGHWDFTCDNLSTRRPPRRCALPNGILLCTSSCVPKVCCNFTVCASDRSNFRCNTWAWCNFFLQKSHFGVEKVHWGVVKKSDIGLLITNCWQQLFSSGSYRQQLLKF